MQLKGQIWAHWPQCRQRARKSFSGTRPGSRRNLMRGIGRLVFHRDIRGVQIVRTPSIFWRRPTTFSNCLGRRFRHHHDILFLLGAVQAHFRASAWIFAATACKASFSVWTQSPAMAILGLHFIHFNRTDFKLRLFGNRIEGLDGQFVNEQPGIKPGNKD